MTLGPDQLYGPLARSVDRLARGERNARHVPGPGGGPRPSPIDEDRGQRFAVHTPNAGFTGVRAGVSIREGVGYTDDERAADDCRSLGYEVADRGGERRGAKRRGGRRDE